MVLGTAKPNHRKSISWPTMRGGDVSTIFLKEFTIVSNEIQLIVIRHSKLAAFNAWKRCRKRVDGQEEHYEGIHDRFLRDQENRESQLTTGWTEQKCLERWTSWHRKITRTVSPKRNLRDIKDSGISH